MKIFILLFFSIVTITANGFLYSCSMVKQDIQSKQTKPVLVKLLPNGQVQFAKSEALIKRTMENHFNDGTLIQTIEIKIDTSKTSNRKGHYYIVGTGRVASNSRIIAIELEALEPVAGNSTMIMVMSGTATTCSGDPCNKCGVEKCTCEGTGPDGKEGKCNESTQSIVWNTTPLEDLGK